MIISLFASAFALGQIAASESTPRAPTTEVRFAVSHALDEGDTFLVAIHDAKGKELGGSQLGPDGFTYVEGRSTSIAKPTYTLDIQLKDGATYHAVVTVPSTLRRVLTFKGKGKGVIELSVSLVMGDVDQNGVVDEYDQEYVLRHEGFTSKDEAKWTDFDLLGRIVWHADLNRDGKIDHTDFSKVTQSLGKRNDPLPWQKARLSTDRFDQSLARYSASNKAVSFSASTCVRS